MRLKNYDLQELINNAIEHGACCGEINRIRKFANMRELLEAIDAQAKIEAQAETESEVDDEHYDKDDNNYAYWAYWYAAYVIRGRWPEVEHLIAVEAGYAYWYARDVIKGGWPEAEPEIINCPSTAYWYTRDVIKRRWPEAEPVIKKEWRLWEKYKRLYCY